MPVESHDGLSIDAVQDQLQAVLADEPFNVNLRVVSVDVDALQGTFRWRDTGGTLGLDDGLELACYDTIVDVRVITLKLGQAVIGAGASLVSCYIVGIITAIAFGSVPAVLARLSQWGHIGGPFRECLLCSHWVSILLSAGGDVASTAAGAMFARAHTLPDQVLILSWYASSGRRC